MFSQVGSLFKGPIIVRHAYKAGLKGALTQRTSDFAAYDSMGLVVIEVDWFNPIKGSMLHGVREECRGLPYFLDSRGSLLVVQGSGCSTATY